MQVFLLSGAGGGDVTSVSLLLLLTHSNIFLVYLVPLSTLAYALNRRAAQGAKLDTSRPPPFETSLESVSATEVGWKSG